MAKYILKGTDPMYNSSSYWIKGCRMAFGKVGWFNNDFCFNSKREAKRWIHRMLHPKNGEYKWLRTGISYRNFEVVTLVKVKIGKYTYWLDPTYMTPKEFLGKENNNA